MMKLTKLSQLLALLMLANISIFGKGEIKVPIEKRFYETKSSTESPHIDGVLDDAIWLRGIWQGGFIQRDPYAGANPSNKTEFQIVYDLNYLYVAINAYDSSPDSISYRVSRRDDIEGDAVGLAIDSYFDKQTAFGFWVNAAGVKKDFIITNDGDNEDQNWDPIWWVKTAKSSTGWTAEMKIPLNQLRFANLENPTWGLQVGRYYFRKQESSYWQFVPKDAAGWVNHFGEIKGLSGLTPKRQVEIAPYVVTKTESFQAEAGNPFMTGRRNGINVGGDARIGITNNFTLDLTVNPDFGQVEADPSVVNLSAFETYFEEKRPFFVAGSNLFNFNLQGGDGDHAAENLFYSRRIGRSPQYSPELGDTEFADTPSNSTILGAAKLSGRNNNGLSVGIMESVTANTFAKVDNLGERRNELVEPLTNYFVGTLKKEFNKGNTIINSIFTATNRQLDSTLNQNLHKSAYTGGVDFQQYWNNKNYFVNAKIYFSHVNGSKEVITSTQESSARYFQRPDATYLGVDKTRTSLTGTGGLLQLGKVGEGHIRYLGMLSWKSPELEINDLGYSNSVDDVFGAAWVGIRFWEPFFIFRSMNINFNLWSGWNFGKQNTYKGGNINLNLQFKNYWGFGTGINRGGERLSNSALWGGPMLALPGSWNAWYNISSDRRKSLSFTVGGSSNWGDVGYSRNTSFFGFINYRPSKKISFSMVPEYSFGRNKMQFVSEQEFKGDTRYIMASINRKTYELSFRAEYSFSPELSLQYYARPYLSSVMYYDYKRITDPQANTFSNRFVNYTDNQMTYDPEENTFAIDEDGDLTNDYTFDKRDRNYLDFQSTMIARWEYRPGSTLFFVWTMGKQDQYETPSTSISNDVDNLFTSYPHNIFLIKFSYRFN